MSHAQAPSPKQKRPFFKKFGYLIIFLLILLFPLWMWVLWLLKSKTELRVVIVDKTVLTAEGKEHSSFNWILTHYKYCKSNQELYSIADDYFGFFPLPHEKYALKGMERFTETQLDSLASANDMCYYTDAYGIYSNEWYKHRGEMERSDKIYGGLSEQDMSLLKKFKEKKKLILTEFNCMASPTPPAIRREFEEMFDLQWTGWVGRYYDNLDTTENKELPGWLLRNYKARHNNNWPFNDAGIVFVNDSDHVEVLEYGIHLEEEVPCIRTGKANCKRFGLPALQKYPYWFDIVKTCRSTNVVSVYTIKPNAAGDSIMNANGILKEFPAVLEHYDANTRFYYFAGDFADNPIGQKLVRFRGIRSFRKLLYEEKQADDREGFFWEYYTPLVLHILDTYRPLR